MIKIAILVLLGQFATPKVAANRSVSPSPPLPNTYMCVGNSIMAGACNAQSPCTRIQAGIPGSTAKQFAVSGYTAVQIRDQYLANYATACNGEPCGTIIVEGGVNSLKASDAITGIVEPETVATMLEIVVHALARGRRVIWMGILPYGTCSIDVCPILVDPGPRATTYNADMLAACTALANPLLTCIDPYSTFQSGLTPNALASQFACSDNIHLQDTSGKTGPQTYTALILAALGY
jgi:hypothetical protein